jgi:AcrR family transcriptional regulator
MIRSLATNASPADVVEAVAAELTYRISEDAADSPLITAYAADVVELFKLTVPELLNELARNNPALVLALCEHWTTIARENLAAADPQSVTSWEQRFKQALQAVYPPADVAVLLEAEGVGALSTILRKRVEETGENPGDVLKLVSRDDRTFALNADAPGAFLANRVRGAGR